MKLVIIKNQKTGKIQKKGAYIYSLKKNGERYAHPSFIEARGLESTQEEILERMRSLNPASRFELAGIEEFLPSLKLQY